MKIGRKLSSWQPSEIIDNYVKESLEFDNPDNLTEEELYDNVNDSEFLSMEWDFFIEDLNEQLKEINPDGFWRAKVENFGWQNLDGALDFHAENSVEFLRHILPNTDCHFVISKYGKGLAIQNWHHDSPTGNEWYYVTPITEQTFNGSR